MQKIGCTRSETFKEFVFHTFALSFAKSVGSKATSEREQSFSFAWAQVVSCNKSTAQESILLKSKTEISPKFYTEDRSNQCSYCVYTAYMCFHIYAMCIFHGVGILFLHSSFC